MSISFPLKSYSTFSFRLEIPTGAEIVVFFGNSRPLSACVHQREPHKALSCVKPRRLKPSCMFFATLRSAATRLREKNKYFFFFKYQRKRSHKVVIFHVYVEAPLSNRLQWKLAHRLGHQPYQSCKFLWL
jgi:hypothetical protein